MPPCLSSLPHEGQRRRCDTVICFRRDACHLLRASMTRQPLTPAPASSVKHPSSRKSSPAALLAEFRSHCATLRACFLAPRRTSLPADRFSLPGRKPWRPLSLPAHTPARSLHGGAPCRLFPERSQLY